MAPVGRDRDASARRGDRGVSSEQRVGRVREIGLGGARREARPELRSLLRRDLRGTILGTGALRVMRRGAPSATLTLSSLGVPTWAKACSPLLCVRAGRDGSRPLASGGSFSHLLEESDKGGELADPSLGLDEA